MAQEELEVEELDNILDSSWIDDFKKQDKEYERYYTDNIHKIKIHSIFININNDIVQIKEEKIKLKQPNYISREEIIGILKKNCINKGLRYSVLSILKYNIDIEPLDVQFYLANNRLEHQQPDNIFLTSIKNIDAIPLKKSISMFEDLNDLFIVFNEKSDETNIEHKHRQKCLTRKIYLLSKSLLGKHKKTARNMKNIIKTL